MGEPGKEKQRMSEIQMIRLLSALRWALLGVALGMVPGSVVAMWFYVGAPVAAQSRYCVVPAIACVIPPFIAVLALISHKALRLEEWRVRFSCDPADDCRICARMSSGHS